MVMRSVIVKVKDLKLLKLQVNLNTSRGISLISVAKQYVAISRTSSHWSLIRPSTGTPGEQRKAPHPFRADQLHLM